MNRTINYCRFQSRLVTFLFSTILVLCLNTDVAAQNFWQRTNGPNRADLRALAINSSGHIFAASYGGGIFRSRDNGENWTAVNSGLSNFNVKAFAINSGGYIFAGTDGGGIFRSVDNSENWTASGLSNFNVNALATNSDGHIFAGTHGGGIFRSMDNGDNWTAVNSGLNSSLVYALAISPNSYIFAGNYGVDRSTNNGDSWTHISGLNIVNNVIALAINSSGYIFAATVAGVYRSTNNGNSWTGVNSGLPGTSFGTALAINSIGHIFWSGSGRGIYRSTTNGDSWTPVNSGLTDLKVGALAINSSGDIFAGTSGGYVFRSVQSTLGVAPSVTTNAATNITLTSATLNGSVNPNEVSTAVKFEYGTTIGYGREIPATPSSVNGASAVAVSATSTGLSPNTLYHYRVVATSGAGTREGADQTFTTSNQAPSAPTLSSPAANAFTNGSTPVLTFNVPSDAEGDPLHFKVEIDDDGNFGAGTLTYESKTSTIGFNPTPPVAQGSGQVTYTVQSALVDGGWWWRVSAWDGRVYGSSSSVRKLIVDVTKPFTANHNPAKGAINVPLNANIVVQVQDATSGVKRSSLVMKVNGNNVSPSITGSASNYILTYDPATNFGFQQTVTVSIDAADSAGNVMTTDFYSFTTESNATPSAPGLSLPAANALTNDNTPALTFNVPSDPNGDLLHFKVEIDDDGNFGVGTQTLESRNSAIGFNPTPPVSQGSGQVTYTVQSGLVEGDWWWRVSAWDGEFYSNTSAARKFIVDQSVPQITPVALSAAIAGQNQTAAANITDNFGILTATLYYRFGGASSYSSAVMINAGGEAYQGTIPANAITERGVEYYFSARDSAGNTATFPATNPQNRPEVIQVSNNNLNFPNQTPAKTYRMISIPFDLNDKAPFNVLRDDFGDVYDDTQWRLLRYVNGVNVELGSSGFANFEPGAGFWLITKEAKLLDAGGGKSVTTAQNFVITLPPGWSQIGNPFVFTVNWSDVIKGANVENKLVGYQGTLNEAAGYDYARTQLVPFEGYFVHNLGSSSTTIEIPPKAATGEAAAKPMADLQSALLGNEWVMQITATSGRHLDKDNYIGCLNNAVDEWDANDFSEAPFFADHISLYFPHREWKKYPDLYTGDFREVKSEGDYWDFVVKSEVGKSEVAKSEVILRLAEVQNLPADWQIILLDKASRVAVNFGEKKNYSFLPETGKAVREFRVVVGQKDFVESNDLRFSGVPQDFVLGQNYPNPFWSAATSRTAGNPETRINYELPAISHLKIMVYNLSGQFIRTLFDGEQSAGRYMVAWNGTNASGIRVASGVYLVRMEVGTFVAVKKMILAK